MDHLTIEPIKNFLQPFIGLPVWGSKKGHGSFLTFNLGEPTLKQEKPRIHKTSGFPGNTYKTRRTSIVGDFFIWVFCCDWKITVEEQEIAHNESSDKEIENGVAFLDGQIIEKITIDCHQLTGSIEFDLKGKISFWNNEYYKADTDLIQFEHNNQWLSLNNLKHIILSDDQEDNIESFSPTEIITLSK